MEYRAIQEPVRTIPGLEEYYQAKAQKLDLADRRVVCEDLFSKQTFRLTYDYLVIATGCKTSTFGTPGVKASEAQHHDDSDGHSSDVFFLKHLWHARRIRNRLIECFERASNPTLTEADQDRRWGGRYAGQPSHIHMRRTTQGHTLTLTPDPDPDSDPDPEYI